MTTNPKVIGVCHLCGAEGELSYEHVPPARAFNDRRIWVANGRQLFERELHALRKSQKQRGAGDYTLCARCNNTTGSWYARAYVDWTCDAMEILERASGEPRLAYPFRLYPQRIIKQIVAMFMSVNSPGFRGTVPYLSKFVLDRESTGLPPDIRIYAGYTTSGYSRNAGQSGILNMSPGQAQQAHVVSEIAFRPFVFVLTLDSTCPEARLADISWFSTCHYAEQRWLYMSLPVLPINSPYPTDYRTASEVRAAKAQHVGRID